MLFETAWTSVVPRTELAILEGHTDLVHAVCAFELSGRSLLASAGKDTTVRVWDPATGEQVRTLHGHTDEVTAVLFLDGALISAGDDRTVRVWDPATGEPLRVLAGYRSAAQVQVNGRAMVASATGDGTTLWDPVTGQLHQVFHGADAAVSAARADGRPLLAARSGRAGVGVWDATTGEPCWQQQPDAFATAGVCWTTDGDRALVAGAGYDNEHEGGRIRLWAAATGELERTIEFEPLVERALDRVSGVRPLTLDGRPVLLVVGQKTVRVLDPVTGSFLQAFVVPATWVETVCLLSLDGRPVVAVSERYRGAVQLWDPATGRQLACLQGEKSPIASLVPFELDDRTLLASADHVGRTVRVWDPKGGGSRPRHHGHRDEVSGVWPVGERLISVGWNTARIWAPATGERNTTIRGSLSGVADVVDMTVAGKTLLFGAFSSYEAGAIRVWDPATGRQIRRLGRRCDEGPSLLCPFTRGDEVLLAAGDSCDVRVWDPATGRLVQETPCATEVIWLGRVVLDGRPAMVGRDRLQGLGIWDPATAAWSPVVAQEAGFAFMLQGRAVVAAAKKNGTVRIGDLRTGETQCTLQGHTGYWIAGVRTMTLGSRTLITTAGGADRTVRLWDPETGQCALTIAVHHEALGIAPLGDGLLAVAVPSGVITYRIREQ